MKVGERAKYIFPAPAVSGKTHVHGEVLFKGKENIILLCDDKSLLSIPIKNFSNLTVISEVDEKSQKSSQIPAI